MHIMYALQGARSHGRNKPSSCPSVGTWDYVINLARRVQRKLFRGGDVQASLNDKQDCAQRGTEFKRGRQFVQETKRGVEVLKVGSVEVLKIGEWDGGMWPEIWGWGLCVDLPRTGSVCWLHQNDYTTMPLFPFKRVPGQTTDCMFTPLLG